MKNSIVKTLVSVLLITFSFKINAQIQWEKSYGGSLYETANSIIQTKDGGYIVFGQDSSCDGDVVRACSGGHFDLWVVKLSSSGAVQWQKSFGGSDDEEAYQIIQTKDKGYALAAITFSSNVPGYKGGGSDAWVLKLDSMGVAQWKKCFGGTGLDEATSIAQTKDGGYIVGGNSVSNDGDATGHHGTPGPDTSAKDDMWVLKLDSLGGLQWQISVGGTNDDGSNAILQAKDGGYMVVGNSKSLDGDLTGKGNKGYNDWMVVKLTPTGTLAWVKLYGGSAQDDAANSITKSNDGGYIIAGADGSTDGDVTGHHGPPCTAAECVDNDVWVIKIDSVGNLKWQKSLGGTGNDNCFSVSNTTDGGYVLGAFSVSSDGNVTGNHGLYDFWAAKIDSVGSLKWQQSLGGTGNDNAYSMLQTSDGGYIMAGTSESNDGDVTGNHGANQNSDIWVVKLGATFGIAGFKNSFEGLNIYPSPTSDMFYIDHVPSGTTIQMYDVSGRLLLAEKITLSKHIVHADNLQSGVYLVELNDGNSKFYRKVMVSK